VHRSSNKKNLLIQSKKFFYNLLNARITNVGEWKAILNAIGNMVEEAMFIVNNDGITFRGMDPSHVALLDVTFPKSSFDHLDSKTSFFGLRVNDFKTVFNTASNNDTVELFIENENMMRVSINGTIDMEYNIHLIEKQEVNTPIPKTDYKAKISVNPNTLSRIISNIQHISEFIEINCNQERVEFSGKGDLGDAKINLDKQNPELKELNLSEDSSAVYSLEYMEKIIRDIGKASKNVSMEYANNNPIHLLFEMPSMVRVEYYLAPRTNN